MRVQWCVQDNAHYSSVWMLRARADSFWGVAVARSLRVLRDRLMVAFSHCAPHCRPVMQGGWTCGGCWDERPQTT